MSIETNISRLMKKPGVKKSRWTVPLTVKKRKWNGIPYKFAICFCMLNLLRTKYCMCLNCVNFTVGNLRKWLFTIYLVFH
jgi:hypothetical protein